MLEDKINPNLSAQYFGFVSAKENGEIIIKKVEPNSITDQNGIAPDDKITKINDKKILSLRVLSKELNLKKKLI